MIKVCHVTSAHDPEDIRIFHKECVSLANAGYDVSLVQPGGSYEKNGIHLIGLGSPDSNRLRRLLYSSHHAYRKAMEVNADVYHLHDPELLLCGLKLKKHGKKVIFDSHEFYAEQILLKPYLPVWSRSLISKVFDWYQKRIFSKIDGVIIPCLLSGINPFEAHCTRTAIVDNVPRLSELYDAYNAEMPKYENSVCQIGSLTHSRGITHLVKALSLVNCTLYLGGVFESSAYEAQIRALPEFASVQYLGKLNRNQVLETLQHCQIGVATLLNIGQYNTTWNLSTKVYEQMALGLPTILNKFPFNETMIEQYQFGICVDPENVEEIAGAIQYLLDNPEEAKRMGENGRRAIKEVFNWSVEEKKLLALYEDVLNS